MIYLGDLKTLYVTGLKVSEEGIKVVLDDAVVEKDSLFYKNFVGKLINFKHNTNLPSYNEAYTYLNGCVESYQQHGYASCLYADYDSIKANPEDKRTVRQLKKEYRIARKRRGR